MAFWTPRKQLMSCPCLVNPPYSIDQTHSAFRVAASVDMRKKSKAKYAPKGGKVQKSGAAKKQKVQKPKVQRLLSRDLSLRRRLCRRRNQRPSLRAKKK